MNSQIQYNDRIFLDERPQKAFRTFLDECGEIEDIDAKVVEKVAKVKLKYLRGTVEERERIWSKLSLEQYWYESLARGVPDYRVYDTDYYLGELWACWVIYSRQYLRRIRQSTDLWIGGLIGLFGQVGRVMDLGCGFGYTTAALRNLFPEAEVIGTNLEDIGQTKLAQYIGRQHGFEVVSSVTEINARIDVVFASDYFEHIHNPMKHLNEILDLNPRVLLVANSFGSRSIGHFDRYDVNGKMLDGKTTSRRFDEMLKSCGFTKMKTGFWNNRPACWQR